MWRRHTPCYYRHAVPWMHRSTQQRRSVSGARDDSCNASGGSSSWYVNKWRDIMDNTAAVLPSEETSGQLKKRLNPSHYLKAISNGCIPDSAVHGLWALFHSLHTHEGFLRFFVMLSGYGLEFDVTRIVHQHKKLEDRILAYQKESLLQAESPSVSSNQIILGDQLFEAATSLAQTSTSALERWLEQSTALPLGMKNLLHLRQSLLHVIHRESSAMSNPQNSAQPEREKTLTSLKSLDARLLHVLRGFFAKQFLVLEELSWKTTPPYVLERVIESEQVHPFRSGLEDMKLRIRDGFSGDIRRPPPKNSVANDDVSILGHQRYVFALVHPSVADEPLISVQVALSRGIESSVDRILCRPTPLPAQATTVSEPMDTAIFYSINNAQPSLKGIELGSTLIKRVAHEIQSHRHRFVDPLTNKVAPVTRFSTLSPIPGYVGWLRGEVAKLESGKPHRIFGCHVSDEQVHKYFDQIRQALGGGDMKPIEVMDVFLGMIAPHNDDSILCAASDMWYLHADVAAALKEPLMRSCSWYLTSEKRRSRILDAVGNFHVSNGAVMYRLNWLGNCSEKGSRESACMMVNYLYDLEHLHDNALRYDLEQHVAMGPELMSLVKQ